MSETRSYGQFCPVALAAEVLAERWTPLLIRELLLGSFRFNDLQRGVPRMSSALLARRLKELEFAGVIERRRNLRGGWDYRLTAAGRELFPVVEMMGLWAQRWLRHRLVETAHLDSDLLMWDIRRTVAPPAGTGSRRYVTEFRLSGVPISRRRYWLVFAPDSIDLCYKDPGFEIDLLVEAELRALTRIWLGHLPIRQAIRDDELRLEGASRDVSAFASWFALSPFAPAGRIAAGQLGAAAG